MYFMVKNFTPFGIHLFGVNGGLIFLGGIVFKSIPYLKRFASLYIS